MFYPLSISDKICVRLLRNAMSLDEQIESKIREIVAQDRADGYLSLVQVQKEFGCSRTWVYRQHANGHLKVYKMGGKTRIKRSELERLVVPL
jgi:excisionase family DNA binding protein